MLGSCVLYIGFDSIGYNPAEDELTTTFPPELRSDGRSA
jgi:hypothetical protein